MVGGYMCIRGSGLGLWNLGVCCHVSLHWLEPGEFVGL